MIHEIDTSNTKSFDNICHIVDTPAPITLRMPISLVRCSATKDDNPNSPRQEMKIASTAKIPASLPTRCSWLNFAAYTSSTNLYSNRADGTIFANVDSTTDKASLALTSG